MHTSGLKILSVVYSFGNICDIFMVHMANRLDEQKVFLGNLLVDIWPPVLKQLIPKHINHVLFQCKALQLYKHTPKDCVQPPRHLTPSSRPFSGAAKLIRE